MPDEYDFKDYKTIEEFGQTSEGSKYYHSLYMKAVNHPVRKQILKIVYKEKQISHSKLLEILIEEGVITDENVLKYNLDYLIKALCILEELDEKTDVKSYKITQSGEVVDFLER